jgi:diguanylate cyclase (GGDEF)-like protein
MQRWSLADDVPPGTRLDDSASSTVTRLQLSQFRALRDLVLDVAASADLRTAAGLFERHATAILGGSVIVSQHPKKGGEPGTAAAAPPVVLALGEHGGSLWSVTLPGPWSSPREQVLLQELARTLPAAFAAAALRERLGHAEQIVAAGFVFARGLTRVNGAWELRQFIVDTMADVTRARLASLALYDEAQGVLYIAATHGYPAVLVEHVRLGLGEGVLGRILESRRPLLVRDIKEVPGLGQRPRYRTPSFLAVPLLAGTEVLGVATFADRLDDRPFDESDLTAARALAAPAALALQNDRLTVQSRDLAHAATVDPLTGLFNRRHFHSRIEEEIERARRYSLELSLLLIDIDDFKYINDTLGHLAGDFLLRQVAEILKRSVRMFDVCTRYGGEEFAILMPGSRAQNAVVVAERIRSRVESASRDDGPLPPHIRITVSLGLAVLRDETSSQELIARADRALYRAKAEGKNRLHVD